MTKRYLAALVLTVILLAFARRMSTRHDMTITSERDGITMVHKTVTENFGDGPALALKATPNEDLDATVFYSEEQGRHDHRVEMSRQSDGFIANLPPLEKGKKWFYQIQVTKKGFPVEEFPKGKDQFIKFKGHIAPPVLVTHILLMFGTIFFGILAVMTAIDVARGKNNVKRSVIFALLAFICAFIGGIPLGIAVSAQTFGGSGWGGWPLGNDVTDTKTEVLLLFWLVTLILSIGALRGRKLAIPEKTYAILVILSFVVTFITFLIPHSI